MAAADVCSKATILLLLVHFLLLLPLCIDFEGKRAGCFILLVCLLLCMCLCLHFGVSGKGLSVIGALLSRCSGRSRGGSLEPPPCYLFLNII